MKYPVKKFVVPKELQPFPNGRIPDKYLTTTEKIGTLYTPAAWWFGVMIRDAEKAGIQIVRISQGYRTFDRQYALFMQRFSEKDLGRKPQVTRIWNQRKWFLRPNFSPVSSPGYSVHGFACAQDVSTSKPQVLEWLRLNAPKYGWYFQNQPYLPNGKPNPEWESWHLNWCWG